MPPGPGRALHGRWRPERGRPLDTRPSRREAQGASCVTHRPDAGVTGGRAVGQAGPGWEGLKCQAKGLGLDFQEAGSHGWSQSQ